MATRTTTNPSISAQFIFLEHFPSLRHQTWASEIPCTLREHASFFQTEMKMPHTGPGLGKPHIAVAPRPAPKSLPAYIRLLQCQVTGQSHLWGHLHLPSPGGPGHSGPLQSQEHRCLQWVTVPRRGGKALVLMRMLSPIHGHLQGDSPSQTEKAPAPTVTKAI